MKKVLKILLGFIGLIIAVGFVSYLVFNESEPQGDRPEEADQLAQKMMAAVNKPAWDTTHYVQWTFKGMHDFVWDKQRHLVKVSWEDMEVLVDLKTVKGQAYKNGQALAGAENEAMVKEAWKFFCNDSFWLNAVVKAFDPGTERSLVDLPNGQTALKVHYGQGGVTPGDAYLWMLDETGLPSSWKMWVEIIPVGGLEFSWEKWETLSTGAKIATFHTSKVLDLDISNLKGGTTAQAIGIQGDIFKALMQ
ncbi:MAG: hypothetical protein AAF985_14945 [Bacteroidota bacterium]